eukprot:TRINITY_DN10381_c0_g1_i2.p1 TRINITY_DN10381_c0_g1~~TRINITY_DN10381_c0_g1_i2.p1  ORF type:complete len:248 (-),score=45.35 TRINITY_DN10381_c0_g1_i2:67-810(-)
MTGATSTTFETGFVSSTPAHFIFYSIPVILCLIRRRQHEQRAHKVQQHASSEFLELGYYSAKLAERKKEAGVEHWNLWYHPGKTPGTADLELQEGAEVEVLMLPPGVCEKEFVLAKRGDAGGFVGCVCTVRRCRATNDLELTVDIDGRLITVGSGDLARSKSPARWAACLRHTREFLPGLRDDEVVIFQNIPELRSVPTIAHAHVFVKPRSDETREALQRLRQLWRLRSPWAEHERLGGRGSEVGFE